MTVVILFYTFLTYFIFRVLFTVSYIPFKMEMLWNYQLLMTLEIQVIYKL